MVTPEAGSISSDKYVTMSAVLVKYEFNTESVTDNLGFPAMVVDLKLTPRLFKGLLVKIQGLSVLAAQL